MSTQKPPKIREGFAPPQHNSDEYPDWLQAEDLGKRKFSYKKKYGYNGYPDWLEIEQQKRKKNPEPIFYASGISITFLTPEGDECTYKYYPFQKKKLSLDDFARVVRSLEDRYLLTIPKTSFLEDMVNNTNNQKSLENIKLRFKNYGKIKKSNFKTK